MNAQAIYEGQLKENPDDRVFLLTRSGFAGLQRYSTASWSGDIGTRWEELKAQISAGLNFSISGIPYWTMDIGGFCVENRYRTGPVSYTHLDSVSGTAWSFGKVRSNRKKVVFIILSYSMAVSYTHLFFLL